MNQPMFGAERWELVDFLDDAFARVERGEGAEAHLLLGVPGIGKTRIVQELYRRLASRQSQPGVWPADLAADPARVHRKSVGPVSMDPTAPAEARAPWLWLSWRCQADPGGAGLVNVLPTGLGELSRVAPWVAAAERRTVLTQRGVPVPAGRTSWEDLFDDATNVVGVLSLFGLLAAVPAVGVAATALGALKRLVERGEPALRRRTGRTLDSSESTARGAADYVARLSRALPVVLAVEDLHLGDAAMGAFLSRVLLRSDSRVLVLGTTLRQHGDAGAASPASERLSDAVIADQVTVLQVPPLPREDSRALVRSLLPALSPDAAERLLDEYKTPLSLRSVLTLPAMQRLAVQEAVSPDALSSLLRAAPTEVTDIARAQWREFPQDVQRSLSMLASSLSGPSWSASGARAVLGRLGIRDPAGALERAGAWYGWVQPLGDDVEGFEEATHTNVSRAAAGSHWADDDIQRARRLWVDWYLDARDRDVAVPVAFAQALRDAHVTLAAAGALEPDEATLQSVLDTMDLELRLRRFDRAVFAAERALDWPLPRSVLRREVERRRAIALDESGEPGLAAAALESLLETLAELHGRDHPETLAIREELAIAFLNDHRFEEGLGVYESVLEAQRTALGHLHEDVLQTEGRVAAAFIEHGQYGEGITRYKQLAQKQSRLKGAEHWDVLSTERQLAHAHWRSADYDAAERVFRRLAATYARKLDSRHPTTLDVLEWLGVVIYGNDKPDEAVELFERVAQARTRAFGSHDQRSIRARSHLGLAMAIAGQPAGVSVAEEAAQQARRVLGQNDETAIYSCFRFARALEALGDRTRAVAEFSRVYEQERALWGELDFETLITHNWLAATLAKDGHYAAAISELRKLIANGTRSLGEDHALVHTDRHRLGITLADDGQYGEAVDVLRSTLEGRSASLVPDHVSTLNTRHRLGRTLSEAGRYDEAIVELRATLDGRTDALGSEGARTLVTRHWLGRTLSEAGRYDEAIVELRATYDCRMRVLGAEEARTLITRQWLGTTLSRHGRYEEAAAELQATLTMQERLLGASHPSTVSTRTWLDLTLRREVDGTDGGA